MFVCVFVCRQEFLVSKAIFNKADEVDPDYVPKTQAYAVVISDTDNDWLHPLKESDLLLNDSDDEDDETKLDGGDKAVQLKKL